MAGVFMMSTCTLLLRLKLAPRWLVYFRQFTWRAAGGAWIG
jgi:hypothetical protein